MKNRLLLWQTFLRSKEWGKRPSELIGLNDPYDAWCFDEACSTWGNTIMGELQSVKGDNEAVREMQQQFVLERYLGIDGDWASLG